MTARRVLPAVLAAACLALAGCGGGASAKSAAATSATYTDFVATADPTTPTTVAPPTTVVNPLAAPSETTAAPAPTTNAQPETPAQHCGLAETGDLIWWEKWPNLPAQVSMIGDIDLSRCKYSWDTLADTEPSGPGYCDIYARPSENPGYDMNATPPARPAHVVAEAGAGC